MRLCERMFHACLLAPGDGCQSLAFLGLYMCLSGLLPCLRLHWVVVLLCVAVSPMRTPVTGFRIHLGPI